MADSHADAPAPAARSAGGAAANDTQTRFSLAVEAASEGLWDWDVVTGDLYWSERIFEALGYEAFPVDIDRFVEHLHPDDRAPTVEAIERHLRHREPYEAEFRLRTVAGGYRWFEGRGQAEWDDEGRPLRMAGWIVDIERRVRARARGNDRERRLRLHNDVLTELGRMVPRTEGGLEGVFEAFTRAAAETLEVPRAGVWLFDESRERLSGELEWEGRARQPEAFLTASEYPQYFAALETGRVLSVENALRDPRTRELHGYFDETGVTALLEVPIRAGGELVGVLCIEARGGRHDWDDLDRLFAASLGDLLSATMESWQALQARRELEHSDARLRAYVMQSFDAVWCIEFDSPVSRDAPDEEFTTRLLEARFVECNDHMARVVFHERADEVIGQRVQALTELSREQIQQLVGAFQRAGFRFQELVIQTFPPGRPPRWLKVSAMAYGSGDVLHGMWGTMSDVTERREADEALRRYEQIVNAVDEPLLFFDESLKVRAANDAALEWSGRTRGELRGASFEELKGKDWTDIRPLVERCVLGEVTQLHRWTGAERTGERRRVDERFFPYRNAKGTIVGLVYHQRDLTEQTRLEQQLEQSQRMESIGRLAGGIAHDFNNILSAIIGYVELCEVMLDDPEELSFNLREIKRGGERAASLTRQLLTFARRQVVEVQEVDLSKLVLRIEGLLRRLLIAGIELLTDLEPNGCLIRVDPGQFEQIVMNLVVNSRDAMPEGGRLYLRTRRERLAEPVKDDLGTEVAPGDWAVLEVRDTGVGMAPDVMGRIFEPFFTTKGQGKGTGLGLSTCHGIVAQAGGHVLVWSEPGEGTTFRVFLPCVGPRADVSTAGAEARILVVEDEPQVREVAVRCLRAQGFRTLSAASAEEALALLTKVEMPDLVVIDLVLPGMNGRELSQRIAELYGDVPVVFATGYAESHVTRDLGGPGQPELLMKPYTPKQLALVIRQTLKRSKG